MTIAERRLQLRAATNGDSALQISEAAVLLPLRRVAALAWLRSGAVRICVVAGKELVIWRDVLAAMERGDRIPEVAPSAARQGLRRSDALRR